MTTTRERGRHPIGARQPFGLSRRAVGALPEDTEIAFPIGLKSDPLSVARPVGKRLRPSNVSLCGDVVPLKLYVHTAASLPSSVPNTICVPSGELRGNRTDPAASSTA